MKSQKLPLSDYATLIFDCDGVLLDSNKVKTEAFYQAALPFGEKAAQSLADYHVANGGISRYKKFAYFLEHIADTSIKNITLEDLLHCYAENVRSGLLSCEVATGLCELRKKTSNTRWLIVSGGDQVELREILAQRELDILFDGGIFGSPDIKESILSREKCNGNILAPALFLGDSKYDYGAAQNANIDFIFMSDWSEVENWDQWCSINGIVHMSNILSINKVLP